MLFSEPKISQSLTALRHGPVKRVSVLFSEPKISQFHQSAIEDPRWASFSALQRAENFSIVVDPLRLAQNPHVSVLFSEPKISQSTLIVAGCPTIPRFQCSSASRKFLNLVLSSGSHLRLKFQCSSASRKFLNLKLTFPKEVRYITFQCSSASRKFLNAARAGR